jgi:type II secretory pathway pseudopilin PulG
MKKALLTISCVVAIVIAYLVVTAERNKVKLVSTVQNLKDIALATAEFRGDHMSEYPTTVEDLRLETSSLTDPATDGPFVFHFPPISHPGEDHLMVACLTHSTRVSWLGERRQYAAFADGSVSNIIK